MAKKSIKCLQYLIEEALAGITRDFDSLNQQFKQDVRDPLMGFMLQGFNFDVTYRRKAGELYTLRYVMGRGGEPLGDPIISLAKTIGFVDEVQTEDFQRLNNLTEVLTPLVRQYYTKAKTCWVVHNQMLYEQVSVLYDSLRSAAMESTLSNFRLISVYSNWERMNAKIIFEVNQVRTVKIITDGKYVEIIGVDEDLSWQNLKVLNDFIQAGDRTP